MNPQDDTQTGSSELEYRSGESVILPERKEQDRPNPRDAIEDEAARKAAVAGAQRLRKMMGLPDEEIPPAPEGTPPEEAPQDRQEQPRDEHGRFVSPNPPETAQDAPAAQEQPEQPSTPTVAKLGPDDLVTIKVGGVEQTVRWEDAQRSIQLEAAARQKLERAALLEKELQTRLQGAPQPAAPVQPNPPSQAPDAATLAQELADKIAYGNKDEIATALQKVLQGTPATQAAPVNPEEILQQVDQRLVFMQQQAAARSDMETFAREHDDIAKDQDLQQLVAVRVQRAMTDDLLALGADPIGLQSLTPAQLGFYHRQAQAHAPNIVRSTIAIMRDAASQVKNRFATPSAPSPHPAIQQKLDAKRAAPAPVNAATARAKPPPAQTAKTPAEIIAEEREARLGHRVAIPQSRR